ncbi:hypothetical protein [Brevibacillus laterosporus]|uniref:hypothetical protein n=1 Tax=Brevibacillus laterosporus TaxID=1465 RepID=UPI00264DDE1C|nr:hypothetical protein [Brevibacillus laterosporus]MDN9009073.1 hypothetical protein [Brevibacillus laterosporus]MDO0942526.1 hypothetical protein [Brevibacillus laterosporus]
MIKLDTIFQDQEIVDTKATIDLHLLVKILREYVALREKTKQLLRKNQALSVNNEQLCNQLQDQCRQLKMLQSQLAANQKNQTGNESSKKDQIELWITHDQFFGGFFDSKE